ncbi:MAG: tetratricopeptide repeat protein [Deltaproteobacteria bacterium]|nr:tetratricopeptide repeat protein [Deltaproteobacteria bacterium]MBW2393070.1 tetratricopeptide repeat protein [Deltaproteobacteria bacterium]
MAIGQSLKRSAHVAVLTGLLLPALLWGVVGCPSTEEQISEARDAVPAALERGDRDAARAAVAALGDAIPENPDELIELAKVLVHAGESPRALWVLEAGVENFPTRTDIRFLLASVALGLSNPAMARTVASQVPEDSPEHADAVFLLAQAELGLGNLESALTMLKQAEARYPDKPESRLVRIATLSSENRSEEAALAVEDAIAAVKGNPDQLRLERTFRKILVQIQIQQEQFEPALATLRPMVEADPTDSSSWQLLTQALAADGQAAEAVALIETNLAGEAPLAELYGLLGPLYAATGQAEKAEQALRSYAARSESPAAVEPLVRYLSIQGDAEGVEQAIREAIERFPDQGQLHVMHVEAFLMLGDRAAAKQATEIHRDLPNALDANREYLRARIELDAGNAEAAAKRLRSLAPKLDLAPTQYWLGRALETLGDFDGARRRFDLARQRDPAWPSPVFSLLGLAEARGDWQQVVGLARLLVSNLPQSREGWLLMSRGLVEIGNGEAALEATDAAKQALPDEPMIRVYHAHGLRLLGRREEALEEIEATLKEFSGEPAVVAEAAIVLGMLDRVSGGIDLLKRGLAEHPDDAGLHAAAAALLYDMGEVAEGDRSTDRALELRPEDPTPWVIRCAFRAANGLHAGAIADCTKYESRRPADPQGPYLRASAHWGAGDLAAAIEAYRRAAQLDPEDHRPLNNLAWLLAQQGDLEAALEAGQEAYRLAPENPNVADTLADLYLRKGLVARAIALLEPAHRQAPEMPDATLHLAQAYVRASRVQEARPLLESLDGALPPNHPLRPALKTALDGLR